MKNAIKIDGKKQASELLAQLDPASRDRILREIRQRDPVLAESLSQGMVGFSKILALDSIAIQKLLRSVPSVVTALAARGMTPDEEALLFSKLSTRQGASLREEREALGPRKKSEVESARQKLVEQALKLQNTGEIDLFTSPEHKKT
jgi:flagellar motor switch protein FliG